MTNQDDMADFYSNWMTDEAMDAYDAERSAWSAEDEEADAFSMMEDSVMEAGIWA